MALSPVHLNRVSFNQQTASLLESVQRNSVAIMLRENQLATGLKLTTPSDDPATAATVLSLDGGRQRQEQILENLRHGTSMLEMTDEAISEIQTLLIDTHAIASQNLGPLTTSEERVSAAELIADAIEQLITVGNRHFNGAYLFAGRDTQNAPFEAVLGGVAFTGDTGEVLAQVAQLDEEPINLTGADLFGALSSRISSRVDLSPRLTADTRLENVVGARGLAISPGTLVVASPGGAQFTINLSSADTLGDIVDQINNVAGSLVQAQLTDTGLTLTPTAGPITVTESNSGTMAADLGVEATTAAASRIVGQSLRAKVTRTTAITDLTGGAGVDLTGGLVIGNGGQTAVVNLTNAQTVQDIINAINNTGLYIQARVNEDGTGLDVINQVSGTNLSISENGGTTAAALGLRSFDRDTQLTNLNFGRGIETVEDQDDLRITAKDGSTIDVNLDGLSTIGDVLDTINAAAQEAGVAVTASLASTGNGIRLADETGGNGPLSVTRLNYSYALDDLGLDQSVTDPATELVGDDVNVSRTDGVLATLVDLERALRANSDRQITDAAERLNHFMDDVNRVNGVVGARAQAMSQRCDQTQNAVVATEQLLSDLRDLDYTEAVTRFQQAQTALQAALTAGSQTMNVSLLDYLG